MQAPNLSYEPLFVIRTKFRLKNYLESEIHLTMSASDGQELLDQLLTIYHSGHERWNTNDIIQGEIKTWLQKKNYDPVIVFQLVKGHRTLAERDCLLALFYTYGIGTPKNNEMKIFEHYQKAAEMGDLVGL